MTLAAVWCSYETPEVPVLWMASDSRSSAEEGRLIDEGVKIFEIPVVCRSPGPTGFFDQTYLEGTVGLACAGGTLVFQNVYGTLVPMLGSLISPYQAVPSVVLRLRVLSDFGSTQLSAITRGDLQSFVDKMLAEELAASTIRNTINPLQAIFRHAVRRELAPLNPTRDLELPVARGRRDRIATAGEASRLIEALPSEDQGLWATAFYAGLRRGELQALRGSDVD